MRRDRLQNSGNTLLNAVIIVLILLVVAVLFWPVFPTAPEAARKAACQNNMKELGLALIMYCGDYNGAMPSSDVNAGRTWSAGQYRSFATKRGAFPPQARSKPVTYFTLLHPYIRNLDIIWCPTDQDGPIAELGFWRRHFGSKPKIGPRSTVSYWYKAVIDRAWFGGTDQNGRRWVGRKYDSFGFPADQIVFYEHSGWHWGDEKKGLSNGATINVTFIDGHVQSKRLVNAGNAFGKSDPLASGEPGWFNYDMKHNPVAKDGTAKTVMGTLFNPHLYGDKLP